MTVTEQATPLTRQRRRPWMWLLPLLVVAVIAAGAAGYAAFFDTRDHRETAADFVEAWNDGDLAARAPDLIDNPKQGQIDDLVALSERCTLDPASLQLEVNAIASYHEQFFVVATCEGKRYLLAGTVSAAIHSPDTVLYPIDLSPDDDGPMDRSVAPADLRDLPWLTV